MRIGFNLLFVAPGKVGSSEILLSNLALAVANIGHEVVLFALKGFTKAHPEIEGYAKVVEVPWSSAKSQPLRIAAENSWLPVELNRRKIEVIHNGVGTSPFIKVRPTVVTIHDIQYRHYPENFGTLRRTWLQTNIPYTLRRSEVTTVPSQFVKSDILRFFDAGDSRIVVVPFGSENLFGPNPTGADAVRTRYRLERPFFFFPSRTYVHKNHRFLIEAYVPLAGDADLVLTGPRWFRDREVAAFVRQKTLVGRVRHLGLVPRPDLAGLYEAALALVYPSRFEGFGAPVLEAMSSGCAAISSNAAALPEVVGDAGILLDPDDRQSWTEAMEKLVSDKKLRSQLAERGRRRTQDFSWQRSASLQIAAYEKAKALARG
jgi:glycosyltransferase involved in cell wall biosynthesis